MRTDIEDAIFHPTKTPHEHFPEERLVALGKDARKYAPRSSHAGLDLRDRRDPLELLERQARSRVPDLVPIRYGRMMASPFAFFRGAALVMASDLAKTPASGLRAQLCGDAHLLNFGMFATPGRRLVFDVNDFDETLPGPWEWDVKRLAASLEIAGRSNGFTKQQRHGIVLDAVHCYHETMVQLAAMSNLEVWYAQLDVEAALDQFAGSLTRHESKVATKAIAKAMREDSAHALRRLTETVDGALRIVSSPPLVVPMRELLGKTENARLAAIAGELFGHYSRSLADHRRALLHQYRFVELARKVVGVGSVGTRCWIALFIGADNSDPLFLQIKEADASVLEEFAGTSEYPNHAQRVVAGQRLMQAEGDILLGWGQTASIDGVLRHFYVRQLRDWKGSFPVDKMLPKGLSLYGRLCGWTLARAHARSSDRVAIACYLGRSDAFAHALAGFAAAYADQNERDHAELVRAVRAGRIHAETDQAHEIGTQVTARAA